METQHLYPKFSPAEYERRYRAVREQMDWRGLDCLLVYGQVGISGSWQANVHYLSNYADTHYHSYLIFPKAAPPILLIAIYPHVLQARLMASVEDVRWMGWDQPATVAQYLKEAGAEKGRIGLVGAASWWDISLPALHLEGIRKALPAAEFIHATDILEQVRMVKSDEEIAALEKGAAFTDMALEGLVKAVKVGKGERDLVAALRIAYLEAGGDFSFELLGSTPMSAPGMPYPWKYPSGRRVEAGDIVVSEISAQYNTYAGQLIRPIAVGKPTKEYDRLFEVAYQTYKNLQKALRPGATQDDILAATAPITDSGLKIHAPVIHGWGQGIHKPFAGTPGFPGWPASTMTLKKGMSIQIEPNPMTADEKHGIFFGGLHIVEDGGARSLQKYPEEFIVVPG